MRSWGNFFSLLSRTENAVPSGLQSGCTVGLPLAAEGRGRLCVSSGIGLCIHFHVVRRKGFPKTVSSDLRAVKSQEP